MERIKLGLTAITFVDRGAPHVQQPPAVVVEEPKAEEPKQALVLLTPEPKE